MRVDTDTHTQNTKHNARDIHRIALWRLHSSTACWKRTSCYISCLLTQTKTYTRTHTLSSEMLLRRLKTLPRAAKRLLWMASLVNHIFVHLKRPNNCTAHAVCISGMFTLNLLFFRDQDQRRDLSLVLLKGEKLLRRMHVETRTHKTQCTIHPPHCILDTANHRLAEKEQVVASRVC